MRSKLGTRSRLAAHLLALALLILLLVYTPPDTGAPAIPAEAPMKPSVFMNPARQMPGIDAQSLDGTLDRVHKPAAAPRAEPADLRPPAGSGPALPAAPTAGAADAAGSPPPPEGSAPPAAADAVPELDGEIAASQTGRIEAEQTGNAAGASRRGATPEAPDKTAAAASGAPETPDAGISGTDTPDPEKPIEDAAAARQSAPEEQTGVPPVPPSADPATPGAPPPEGNAPAAAATPLPDANLEVLGDGVYWLDPGHDLETELAAIPELRSLILLAPLPGYRVSGFEHVKTEIIPADPADLTDDAADRFIHLTGAGANRPTAIAVAPATRGAAFFKGLYLLRHRQMSLDAVLREISPRLDDAGEARDDIIHRLSSLKN